MLYWAMEGPSKQQDPTVVERGKIMTDTTALKVIGHKAVPVVVTSCHRQRHMG